MEFEIDLPFTRFQLYCELNCERTNGLWGGSEYHFYYYDIKTILCTTFQACGKCFETDESIDGFVSLRHRLFCLLVDQQIVIIKLVVIPNLVVIGSQLMLYHLRAPLPPFEEYHLHSRLELL